MSSPSAAAPHNVRANTQRAESVASQRRTIYYTLFALFFVIFLIIVTQVVSNPNNYLVALLVVALLFLGLCFYWLINGEGEAEERNPFISR